MTSPLNLQARLNGNRLHKLSDRLIDRLIHCLGNRLALTALSPASQPLSLRLSRGAEFLDVSVFDFPGFDLLKPVAHKPL